MPNIIYFKIDPVDQLTIIDVVMRDLLDPVTKEVSAINGKPFYVQAIITDPPFDPTTEVKEGPVDSYDGNIATRVYTVRAKTAQELADEQTVKDIAALRNAGKDAVLVLVELIEWQLTNTAMTANDFSADVKQAFLDLQVIANRLRGI